MTAREQIKFWHEPTLNNLELLHARYVTHAFAPHIHEGYAIGVIERGAEQFLYRKSRHVAGAGSIVFINPGEVHTGEAAVEGGWTYRMLYPATELLQRAASDMVGRERDLPFFAEPVVYDSEMAAEIVLTHRALEEQISALERESRLLWTMARLIARYADDRPRVREPLKEHQGVQRVRAYLDEHYTENVSLAELAALAQLSQFHLLRSFRSQMNLPPHAYQIQVRILRAKQLLRAGVSCVDTALAVGFADQSHFTRHFKRIVGAPPGLYSAHFSKEQYSTRQGAPRFL
jgi:AraC-like DNA-binding protein